MIVPTILALLLGWHPSSLADTPPAEKYREAATTLTRWIEREVREKQLPALSIALVDDQKIVWSRGFGYQDRARTIPATAETVYRVGSVSKLFTDVAVMQLVERGVLDLDAPITRYLPHFQPTNPFNQDAITLRQLMSHRSGLVREPPVGNYFDDDLPTLAQTVASLNRTTLVYPPGTRTKYSNAAISVVGRVLETQWKQPFADGLRAHVLEPLGMSQSAFQPTNGTRARLADAIMWTYHGREFPAPRFELGMAPAGSMYSTVSDLARFVSCVLAEGRAEKQPMLKPESLRAMLTRQFHKPDDTGPGFGLGFLLADLDGHRRIGHGGAMYGFATELALLPDAKLGVIVVTSRDVANRLMTRIADESLRTMLAVQAKKPLPDFGTTEPLRPGTARRLAGIYRDTMKPERWFEIVEFGGHAYVTPGSGGIRAEIRQRGANLFLDDATAWGPELMEKEDTLTIDGTTYRREPSSTPPPAPPRKWDGLIGEYGEDHNVLYIYERAGQLHALIEWVEVDPLTPESDHVFAFPKNRGMYFGEKLVFTRDASGRATQVVAAGVTFLRRKVDGDNGETFRIQPLQPIATLRDAALKAQPPQEKRPRQPELVALSTAHPDFRFDIRYATANNFLGTPVYTSAQAFLQKPAAEALSVAQRQLMKQGYGLLIHDGYRPWYVTKLFWDATPPGFRNFVANPRGGSRHNRGCAVDLSLYDLQTKKPVPMVSGYDEFSQRSYAHFPGGTSRQRWHRDLLRHAMEDAGFSVYDAEWWHFDYRDWAAYPLGNLRFEDLPGGKR
ncbi:MAG: serine hydrolase [Bacteroidales bacterium]|nr:serine hydrolase [Bacteroidales bacterium]